MTITLENLVLQLLIYLLLVYLTFCYYHKDKDIFLYLCYH